MSTRPHDHMPAVDSLFSHFSRHEHPRLPTIPTSSTAPVVLNSKPSKKNLIKKSSTTRPPLSDKTRTNNVTPHDQSSPHSMLEDCTNTTTPSSPSFRPLPPADAASFGAPSLMDFSFHTLTTSPDITPLSPFFAPSATFCSSPEPVSPTIDSKFGLLPHPLSPELPEFSHPNSPYVPWTSPVAREILRPITPGSILSAYSRPYSRSGARAPEPTESREELPRSHVRFATVTNKLKSFRLLVKANVKDVAKRFKNLGRPLFPSIRPSQTLAQRTRLSCSTPALPSPALSGESTHTTSLAAWLAERQRENNEETSQTNGMSIEEYDRMGSWVDVSRISDEQQRDEEDDFLHVSVKKSVPPPCNPADSMSRSPGVDLPSRCSYSHSSPQLSRASPWTESSYMTPRETLSGASNLRRQVSPTSDRYHFMPGGWSPMT